MSVHADDPAPRPHSRTRRLVGGILGVIFLATGAFAILLADTPIVRRGTLGAALIALGVEALVSAFRGKDPWLARIGPLP